MITNEQPNVAGSRLETISPTGQDQFPAGSKLGHIAPSEFTFLFFFTLVLCLVTTLPSIVGRIVHVPGTVFTDVFVHSFDSNNYLAYARQGAEGKWLFHNPMTAEPHRNVLFNLEWLLIGRLSSLLRISLAAALNLLRLVCLVLLCFGVYWLSSFLFPGKLTRRIVLVTTLAGGGFGWLAALHILHIPIDSSLFLDLTNANLFPFYWALKVPHFLVSESLAVLGLCFFLRGENAGCTRDYTLAGLCYLASGACRPYEMLLLMAATVIYLIVSYVRTPHLPARLGLRIVPVFGCVPLLVYYYWIFKIHPIFRWWSFPGNPAPAAWLLMLGFGPVIFLLPLSLWKLRRTQLTNAALLMFCCLITATIFTYMHGLLHFSFQFATNIFIPLVMIVMLGLQEDIRRWWRTASHWRTSAIAAILFVNSLTSLALTAQLVWLTAHGDFRASASLLQSFSWLDAHSRADDAILADFDISNNLPQYTKNVVYCGYLNAVNFGEKFKNQRAFFDPQTKNEFRSQLIEENPVRFVLLTSEEEREIPAAVKLPSLKEVFRNDAAVVFAVQALR
jgi:hypothetical protein